MEEERGGSLRYYRGRSRVEETDRKKIVSNSMDISRGLRKVKPMRLSKANRAQGAVWLRSHVALAICRHIWLFGVSKPPSCVKEALEAILSH
jgi:hypothetical protein